MNCRARLAGPVKEHYQEMMNAGIGRMSALGANRTRRDSGNDVNDPDRTLSGHLRLDIQNH